MLKVYKCGKVAGGGGGRRRTVSTVDAIFLHFCTLLWERQKKRCRQQQFSILFSSESALQ